MQRLMEYAVVDGMWDDFIDWTVKSTTLSRQRTAHGNFKKMWDGIKKPAGMDLNLTVINQIRREFPQDAAAKTMRPLGDFKDIMHLDHEEMYEALCEEFTRLRKDRDGRFRSFFRAMESYCEDLWEDYFTDEKKWLTWGDDYYAQAISLMLYGSAEGIWLENKVHNELTRWVNLNSSRSEAITYERAEASQWESKDVDGIFRNAKTGEIVVKVSIKCKRALTRQFIENEYRGKKGKTEPDIYIGYENIRSESMTQIDVDGRNLNQLLKDALNGQTA